MAHSDVLGSAIPDSQQMELQKAICSLLGMVGDGVARVLEAYEWVHESVEVIIINHRGPNGTLRCAGF